MTRDRGSPRYLSGPAAPWDITRGADGDMWFVEDLQYSKSYSSKLGRITPSGKLTLYPSPHSGSLESITRGPDGNAWFIEGAESTYLGKIHIGRGHQRGPRVGWWGRDGPGVGQELLDDRRRRHRSDNSVGGGEHLPAQADQRDQVHHGRAGRQPVVHDDHHRRPRLALHRSDNPLREDHAVSNPDLQRHTRRHRFRP